VPKAVGRAKDDCRHYRSSKQHANGCVRLARYDFLLVFYGDLGSVWVEPLSNYKPLNSEES